MHCSQRQHNILYFILERETCFYHLSCCWAPIINIPLTSLISCIQNKATFFFLLSYLILPSCYYFFYFLIMVVRFDLNFSTINCFVSILVAIVALNEIHQGSKRIITSFINLLEIYTFFIPISWSLEIFFTSNFDIVIF